MDSPSERLLGLVIDEKWAVEERLPKKPYATGGNFSTGYWVRGRDGATYFLKALDIAAALSGESPMKDLEALFRDFNFEAEVNDRCRGLDRVVRCVGHGSVLVDPENVYSRVPYLVFERATGDIRRRLVTRPATTAWRFRALHQMATGLHQLHGRDVSHQDLKPSNVMVFDGSKPGAEEEAAHGTTSLLWRGNKGSVAKVGDLGRSCCGEISSRFDELPFAGDRSYAPPEILYREPLVDIALQRRATDMFMLASMLVFLFGGITLSASLLDGIPATLHPMNHDCKLKEAVPALQANFGRTVAVIENEAKQLGVRTRNLLVAIGEPDVTRRGHPRNLLTPRTQYSLERIVAELDVLARKATQENL